MKGCQIAKIFKNRDTSRAFACLVLLPLLWMAPATFAANQGQLAANSSGDLEITVTLGLLGRISGLNDFIFGSWAGGDLNANDNLCVGLLGTSQYRIRADGSGNASDPNAFALSNGSQFIPYRVFFNDSTGTTGRQELTAANSLAGQTAAGFGAFLNALIGCVSNNANVSLLIEQANLNVAEAGSYNGTLTLTLIPE